MPDLHQRSCIAHIVAIMLLLSAQCCWNSVAFMDLTRWVAVRQAVPKAQQFNQEVLLPAAKYVSAELQAQAYEIAVQARPS